MEHPLISSLENLTTEQLQEKMTDIQKKLMIAYKLGNAQAVNQLLMALESYRTKWQERMDKQFKDSTGSNFTDKIDIS